MKYSPIFILSLLHTLCLSQDILPVRDEADNLYSLRPGLYLSSESFTHNNPIDFSQISTDYKGEYLHQYILSQKTLKYSAQDSIYSLKISSIWGYSDGKSVFLNKSLFYDAITKSFNSFVPENRWVKINILATLSLIHCVNSKKYYSKTQGYQTVSSQFTFIFNTKNKKLYEPTLRFLKKMIADDKELLAELNSSREKKEDKLYIFLKRYNERHPLKFE